METFIQSKIPFPISLVQRIEYGCLKKGFSVKNASKCQNCKNCNNYSLEWFDMPCKNYRQISKKNINNLLICENLSLGHKFMAKELQFFLILTHLLNENCMN